MDTDKPNPTALREDDRNDRLLVGVERAAFDAGARAMREHCAEMLLAGLPNTYERNTLELRIRAMKIEHLEGRP